MNMINEIDQQILLTLAQEKELLFWDLAKRVGEDAKTLWTRVELLAGAGKIEMVHSGLANDPFYLSLTHLGGLELPKKGETVPETDLSLNDSQVKETPKKINFGANNSSSKEENENIPPLSASPQAEDGHIDIANEIAEALAKINLSPYESRILWVIWRKTYGWHKKEAKIALTTFQKITGLPRRNVTRILFKLIQRKIVNKTDDGFIRIYGFQKDYTKWQNRGDSAPVGAKLPLPPQIGAKQPPKLSSKLPPLKEKKEIIHGRSQKKETDPKVKDFFKFWGETFFQNVGERYSFTGGKEGNLIKSLLRDHDLPRLQELTFQFFKDEQCCRRGLTIGIFKQEVNRLKGLKAMDPLEQAKRELSQRKE